jgi:hypothetical protein
MGAETAVGHGAVRVPAGRDHEAEAAAEHRVPAEVLPRLAGLAGRRREFAVAYLWGPRGVRLCATRAATAAGYAWGRQAGSRLLRTAGVGDLIQEILDQRLGGRPGGPSGPGRSRRISPPASSSKSRPSLRLSHRHFPS